jgi:hypothetical protein
MPAGPPVPVRFVGVRLSRHRRDRQAHGGADHVCEYAPGDFVPLCTISSGCSRVARRAYSTLPGRRAPTLFKVSRYLRGLVAIGACGMEEKRKHPRTEVEVPAFVSSGGSVMSCVVRNISREGAAIDVDNPVFVPQRFRLVMAKDSNVVHECSVAWIKQNRIGVTFLQVADATGEPPAS